MSQSLYHADTARLMSREGQGFKPPAGGSCQWLTNLPCAAEPELDTLNRALVVGLMLEVILENPRLVEGSGSQRQRIKACLRSNLASQLAGRIPLASFQSLVQGLDHWFEVFYPVLAEAGLGKRSSSLDKAASTQGSCPLREDLFRECLDNNPGLLPKRRHRKCDPEKLQNFLESTAGKWFRLRDFEEHFQMDRKTAWEYAQKLLQAGLLVHNQGHSSAVRYRVETRFLQAGWASPADHAGSPVPGSTSLS